MTVHIYAPDPLRVYTERHRCPWCSRPPRLPHYRTFVVASYEWYGATWTCLTCGEQWTDGEHHERPFSPGWRETNIREAVRVWRRHR